MDLIYKSGQGMKLKDADEEKGIIKGIGSYFGNEDSDGDVMVKGCYEKSIKENFKRMRYLYQHRSDQLLGKFTELNETSQALEFVAKINIKTDLGRNVFELIKGGEINENSVGFAMIKNNYDKQDGVNYITEAKLYEISAVTFAANPMAVMQSYKSLANGNELMQKYLEERFESLHKLVKSSITDNLALAVEFEIKALKDLVLNPATKSEPTPQESQEAATQKEEEPAKQEEQDDSHSKEQEQVVEDKSKEVLEALNAKGIYAYLRDNL